MHIIIEQGREYILDTGFVIKTEHRNEAVYMFYHTVDNFVTTPITFSAGREGFWNHGDLVIASNNNNNNNNGS